MAEIQTQGLVTDAGNESAGGMSSRYLDPGISAGRGLLASHSGDQFNQGLSYGDQSMSQAIKNRYMKNYSMGERHLANEMNKAGQNDYLKKLAIASDMAGQEHQMNVQKEILRQKQKAAKKAMRGQIVGTVLGITGAVAGGFAGGGVGAMAGYKLGEGAGNAIGGA